MILLRVERRQEDTALRHPRLVIELSFWLVLSGAAFAFSFEFDQHLGMYKFGAAAWPRIIILLMVAAAVAQFWCERKDSRERPNSGRELLTLDEGIENKPIKFTPCFVVVLLLPIIYALLLDYTGFFVNAPLFILAYLLVTGERRWRRLAVVTAIIYVPLVLVFTKLFYLGLPLGNVSPFYEISAWLIGLLRQ